LDDASGTDEERKVVDKYIHRRGNISREDQGNRNAEKKRISSTRRKWKADTQTYRKEIEELNDANGTDEERKVVDKYIHRRKR